MKKVFKFILWGLLVILGTAGITVLATAISGGFNPEKVYITNLTINGAKEYATISQNEDSYTGRVDFLPVNANQLNLTAKIVTGSDVIKEMPVVKAGENFTIEFATEEITDVNGEKQTVTKGGEVEIKFVDSSTNAFATLKILVDVGVTANNLKVTSDTTPIGLTGAVSNADSKTKVLNCKVGLTTTKLNTIKISTSDNKMLNSYKGSWTKSDINNSIANVENMKKMLYYNYDKESLKDLKLEAKYDKETGNRYYIFTYYSPVTTLSDPARLSIYLYRSYYNESIFSEALWQNITNAIRTGSYSESALNYADVNNFINTYMYGKCSNAQRECLDKLKNTQNGLINLNPANDFDNRLNALNAVIDYVFVHFNLDITVTNIEIKNIGIINEDESGVRNFNVLMNHKYTVSEMREKFVKLESDAIGTGDDEAVLTGNIRKLDIMVVRKLDRQKDYPVDEKGDQIIYKDDKDQIISTIETCWDKYWQEKGKDSQGNEIFKHVQYRDYFFEKTSAGIEDNNIVYIVLKDSPYLSIKKDVVDGEASWTFKTQINTPSTNKYYIFYKYRNNDVSKMKLAILKDKSNNYKAFVYDEATDAWMYQTTETNSDNVAIPVYRVVTDKNEIAYLNGTTDSGKQVVIDGVEYTALGDVNSAVKSAELFFNANDYSWTYYDKESKQVKLDIGSEILSVTVNDTLFTELMALLNRKFDDIYALAQFNVNYVESKIELNGGTTEDFVLNSNTVYTMQNGVRTPVEGLNYISKKIYTTGSDARISIKANNNSSTAVPEYKTIKWLVKAEENTFIENNTTYYRFLPSIIKKTESVRGEGEGAVETTKTTYSPVIVSLVNAATGKDISLDGGETATEFMELGTNDFTLRALNVISQNLAETNKTITLYPVVIQTLDEKGTPYLKEGKYSAVCMGSGDNTTIKLTSTKYIENLYAFADSTALAGVNKDAKQELKNISNTTGSENTVQIENGGEQTIYLSSIQLAYSEEFSVQRAQSIKENINLGEVICYDESISNMNLLNDNPAYDKNMDVLEDVVCYEYSEKVALYNYYVTIKDRWQNQKAYNCEATMGESGQLSEYDITIPSSTEELFYIRITIKNINTTVDKGFNLTIFANGEGTGGTKFSVVETVSGGNGVSFSFKLLKTTTIVTPGGEDTGSETGE